MVVRGYDRESRAVFHRTSRLTAEVDEESFSLFSLYLAERAFACSEIYSKGRYYQIVAVLDYSEYGSSLVPPTELLKDNIKTMQKIYPDRARKGDTRHATRRKVDEGG
jgi:hypothetical protein